LEQSKGGQVRQDESTFCRPAGGGTFDGATFCTQR
jgi:hypothetical protein